MNMSQSTSTENERGLIQSVEEAIGKDDPDDYSIRPTGFPDELADTAPELSDVLSHSSLTETAKRYELQDAEAGVNKKLFNKLSERATWAIFIAATAAALLAGLTAVRGDEPPVLFRVLLAVLGLCSLVGGVLATTILYRVSREQLLRRWMSSRAAAESERLGYFNKVVKRVIEKHPDNPRLFLMCLEFFRRYQLAVQQTYYKSSVALHRASASKTITIGAIAAAILSIGAGGFGIAASLEPFVLPFSALGTIGAALALVASRREELRQDERNSERYLRTHETLSHIRERHSEVQRALAQGNSELLTKYVAAVHEQLSLEHRQWLETTEAMDSTIKELHSSLEALPIVQNRE